MDKIKLKALGLSDPEIKIYMALLKTGPLSASQLSKNTGMYRPYVYDTLENLIGKDLVTYTIRKSKKEFECAPPSALKKLLQEEEEQLKQKQDIVDSLVPILKNMYAKPFSEFIIEKFEGENIEEDLNKFIKNLQKKEKINEILCFGKNFKLEKKESKIKIKNKIKPKMKNGIICFNDYIIVFENNNAILIKNKSISNIFKNMFDMI